MTQKQLEEKLEATVGEQSEVKEEHQKILGLERSMEQMARNIERIYKTMEENQ